MHERLGRAYGRHLRSIGQVDGALPLTVFMCSLAKASNGACHAVLEAGFLDVPLAMCFLEQLQDITHDLWSHLKVFTTIPEASQIFQDHSLQHFWPKPHWNSRHLLERQEAWKTLENLPSAVRLRCAGIHTAVHYTHATDGSTSLNVCADLLEFLRSVYLLPSYLKIKRWLT